MEGLISVIIPNYNRTAELQRAIQSVLSQSYQHFEIIVVDDHSSTDPQPFLDKFGDIDLRLIRHDNNQHAAAARNTGARHAKGDFLAFLDSDDQWLPIHLELRIKHIESNPFCQGIYGGVQIFQDGVYLESPKARPLNNGELMLDYLLSGKCKAQTSTFFFRKSAFMNIQFNPELQQHQDYDLNIRFQAQYKEAYCCLPEPTVKLHISSTLDSITKKIHHPSCLQVVRSQSKNISFQNLYRYCLAMAESTLINPKNSAFTNDYLTLLLNNQTSKSLLEHINLLIWKIFKRSGLKLLLKLRPSYFWTQGRLNRFFKRFNG